MKYSYGKIVLMAVWCAVFLAGCTIGTTPAGSTSQSEGNASSVSSSEPLKEETENADQASLEPPLSEKDKQVPVPAFLTEEQQLLYLRAYKMELIRIGTYVIDDPDRFPCETPDTSKTYQESVVLGGQEYHPALNRYQSWDLFYDTLQSIFTEDYLENSYLSSDGVLYFCSVDGQMYYLSTERGYDPRYDQDTTAMDFTLLNETPDQIDIQVTATYAVDEQASPVVQEGFKQGLFTDTYTYEISLERGEDGWRFSRFGVPF